MRGNLLIISLFLLVTVLCGVALVRPTFLPAQAQLEACNDDGWCWENPLPLGDHFFDIWGFDSNNVYLFGNTGQVTHFDGVNYTIMDTGVDAFLTSGWGTGPNHLVAVGNDGAIVEYNGQIWTPQQSGTTNRLHGVWGTSPSNMYAVGKQGTILHYDGNAWTAQDPLTDVDLYDVWGSGVSDIYVVGLDGTILHSTGDGNWVSQTKPATGWLLDIWGTGASDVFAAGAGGLILHNDGGGWTQQSSKIGFGLYSVWGFAPNDVYAVGGFTPTIMHYDGTSWTIQPTRAESPFTAVWGSSPTNVYAVGGGGLLYHNDGTGWSEVSSGRLKSLEDIWGSDPDNLYAVGADYQSENFAKYPGAILHNTDSRWAKLDLGFPLGKLNAIWGTGPNNIWAAGEEILIHFDGRAWSRFPGMAGRNFNSLHGAGPDDLYAVGFRGVILHFNGEEWVQQDDMDQCSFLDVWAQSPSNVYAAGISFDNDRNFQELKGCMYRYDGTSWELQGKFSSIFSIWGSGADNVYAASHNGIIYHYDGTAWNSLQPFDSSMWFRSIGGTGPEDIYVTMTGETGCSQCIHVLPGSIKVSQHLIGHFDGIEWSILTDKASTLQKNLWLTPNDVYAVGFGGTIMRGPLASKNASSGTPPTETVPSPFSASNCTATKDTSDGFIFASILLLAGLMLRRRFS